MNHLQPGTMKESQSMNLRPWKVLGLAALLLLPSVLAWAGTEERLGTGGASELRIPVGARSVGLCSSNVGNTMGVEALFTNPAGLAATDSKTEVLFSYALHRGHESQLHRVAVKMGNLGSIGFRRARARRRRHHSHHRDCPGWNRRHVFSHVSTLEFVRATLGPRELCDAELGVELCAKRSRTESRSTSG